MGLTVLGILTGMYAVYQLATFTYNLTYAFWMNHYAAFDTEDNNLKLRTLKKRLAP
jgi:hypothetical protein